MVKNLPASAGDMGSTLGPGRSHVRQSNSACVPQLLRLCSRDGATTTDAHTPRDRAPQQEMLPQ